MVVFVPIGIFDKDINNLSQEKFITEPSQALLENSSNIISFKEILRKTVTNLDSNNESIVESVLNDFNLQHQYESVQAINSVLNQEIVRNALSKALPFQIYILKCESSSDEIQSYRKLLFLENHWSYGEKMDVDSQPKLSSLLERFHSEELQEQSNNQEESEYVTEEQEQEQAEHYPTFNADFISFLLDIIQQMRAQFLIDEREEVLRLEEIRKSKVAEMMPKILNERKDYLASVDKALVKYFKFGFLEKGDRINFIKDAVSCLFLNKINNLNEEKSSIVNKAMIEKLVEDYKIVEKIISVFTDEEEFKCPVGFSKPENPVWINRNSGNPEMKTYDCQKILKTFISTGKSPMDKIVFDPAMLVSGLNPHQVKNVLDDLLEKEFRVILDKIRIAQKDFLVKNVSFATMFKPSSIEDIGNVTPNNISHQP